MNYHLHAFKRSSLSFWRHYRAYFSPYSLPYLSDDHADQLAWMARSMAHNARMAGLL